MVKTCSYLYFNKEDIKVRTLALVRPCLGLILLCPRSFHPDFLLLCCYYSRVCFFLFRYFLYLCFFLLRNYSRICFFLFRNYSRVYFLLFRYYSRVCFFLFFYLTISCLIHPFASPLLFPCDVWDTHPVHGSPGPYSPR